MRLSDSVIIPRAEFEELEFAAYTSPKKNIQERAIDTVQASVLIVVTGAVMGVVTWVWVKTQDKIDEKNRQRRLREDETLGNPFPS